MTLILAIIVKFGLFHINSFKYKTLAVSTRLFYSLTGVSKWYWNQAKVTVFSWILIFIVCNINRYINKTRFLQIIVLTMIGYLKVIRQVFGLVFSLELTLVCNNSSNVMEATHVADRKATYLYDYVRSLYLYVNFVKCKRALPCLIILWDYTT
jgi:hypothetical protein